MAQAAFDTIAEVQRLRDSGLEQAQAEAITRAIHAGVTGGVATKADLDLVRTELQGEIQLVRTELQGEMQTLRTDLKWIMIIGAAILGVLVLPWIAQVIGVTLPRL